jgi:WG containing repeat
VIPRSFAGADDFHEGFAAVTGKDGTWGYIDKTGQFAIAPRFESAMEFSEGLAAIKLGGMWGWINKSGDIVIAPTLEEEEVGVFRSGMAMVVHNRKLGYINTKGEIVIPQTLDGGTEFIDGVAMASAGWGYAVMNSSGKVPCHLKSQ